jgi:hypothetical protein
MQQFSTRISLNGPISGKKEASHLAPSLTLIGFHSDQFSTHLFHAARDGRGAARGNQVSVGVEDFKRNCIRELVPVTTDLDDA